MKISTTALVLCLTSMSSGHLQASENDIDLATPVTGTSEGGLMDQLGVSRSDTGVDWDAIDNHWDAFKEIASERWRELTVEDWETIEGNRHTMLGVLGKRTGKSTGDLELELQSLVERL